MAELFLKAEINGCETAKRLLSKTKKSNSLSELHKFAVKHQIVGSTYVIQREDDPDFDIRISMNEINDVYETGERPEDLDFF